MAENGDDELILGDFKNAFDDEAEWLEKLGVSYKRQG
jgi:hypothetical protein